MSCPEINTNQSITLSQEFIETLENEKNTLNCLKAFSELCKGKTKLPLSLSEATQVLPECIFEAEYRLQKLQMCLEHPIYMKGD